MSTKAGEDHFSDPVFPELRGWRAAAMWQMLCSRGTDLKVAFSGVSADGKRGQAHWDADYSFSLTGRMVHNPIDARFRFAEGKIIDHQDSFDIWRWMGMAMGLKGRLLGWLPPVQGTLRKRSNALLERFIAENGLGPQRTS